MHTVITGANRGIGAALAAHYKARDAKVTGTSRSGGELMCLDVTRPESHSAMAAKLGGAPIDLLICNAGVFLDKGHALEAGYDAEIWAETYATNVTGVFLTVQSLLANLQAAQGAKIAIVSSLMASQSRAPGGSYIYRSSKAAALNLGRNLAGDLRGKGIAVGIYHPGWVRTDMGGGAADISVDQAAAGLSERFDALSLQTTGCFETWDGQTLPF